MRDDATRGPVDVTVVMPAKDRAHLIERALASVKAQNRPPREVIVVDDGSSDDTAAVAERSGARVIRLSESRGIGSARNAGVLASGSRWIAFLDSDDEWEAHHLEALVRHAEDHVLVTSPGRTSSGRLLGNPWSRPGRLTPIRLLVPGDALCTSGTMVTKRSVLAAGLFGDLPRAQDLDLWIRVLETGTGLALAGPSVLYHEHPGQVSVDRELTRKCFDQIVADCARRPWMRPRDVARSYSRVRWDDLRAAQRDRSLLRLTEHALWFARRPYVLPTLGRLLWQRRAERRPAPGR